MELTKEERIKFREFLKEEMKHLRIIAHHERGKFISSWGDGPYDDGTCTIQVELRMYGEEIAKTSVTFRC